MEELRFILETPDYGLIDIILIFQVGCVIGWIVHKYIADM
jgi:hypothetical protein